MAGPDGRINEPGAVRASLQLAAPAVEYGGQGWPLAAAPNQCERIVGVPNAAFGASCARVSVLRLIGASR